MNFWHCLALRTKVVMIFNPGGDLPGISLDTPLCYLALVEVFTLLESFWKTDFFWNAPFDYLAPALQKTQNVEPLKQELLESCQKVNLR